MPYIIDGNNLIGSSTEVSLEDPDARTKLIEIVKKFQESKKSKIIIVFDGEPENGYHHQLPTNKFNIIYPRFGDSADDEIKKILNGYSYFKDVVLVTSDRELKTYARKKGAKVVNSIEFNFELKRFFRVQGENEDKQDRIQAKLSDQEVDHWLKIFED